MKPTISLPGLAAIVALVAMTSSAAGQDKAAAEALFQDGKRLVAAGDHKAACDKFAASDKLDPSVGARIQLGRCNEKQGKTASAWASFKAAQNLAVTRGDTARGDAAQADAKRLEPSLTYVVLRRAAGKATPDLSVSFDGVDKPVALLGQRFPIDPGEHVVAAEADGFKTWEARVTAGQPGQEVAVEIPALAAIAKPIGPDNQPNSKPDQPDLQPDITPPAPGPSEGDPGRGRRTLAYGIGAGGLAIAATGLVFGALAKSKYDSRTDGNECDSNNVCSDAGLEIIDSAKNRALIASVLVPVGLAAIGTAVVLFFTAPDGGDDPTAVGPMLGPDHLGVSIGGSF